MIQTLVLENSVHSQISIRILSGWVCFTSLSNKEPVVVNTHLMSSSAWSWYRCLV